MLLVYDITKKGSFESLEKWLAEVQNHADPKTQIILIGNKTDLAAKRQVTQKEGESFAARNCK